MKTNIPYRIYAARWIPGVLEVVKYLLILIFVYTGVSKIIGHYGFVAQINTVPFLKAYASIVALLVPVVEVVTGGMLSFQKTELIGWWLSAILFSVFTIYIIAIFYSMPALPCSCGGIVQSLTWQQHLALNTIFCGLCWSKLYHQYFISKFSMHTRE